MEEYKVEIRNLRTENCYDLPWVFRVDRASPVGNPFYMANENRRDEVCYKYEIYFNKQIETNLKFRRYADEILNALRAYHKVALYCWCAPKRCHAETIKRWLENQIKGDCV